MSKPANAPKTRGKTALIMAAYTVVLAVGAALPLAASYSDAIAQRTPEGHIRGGAYPREPSRTEACDEAQRSEAQRTQAQRSARRGIRVEISPADSAAAQLRPCAPIAEPSVTDVVPRGS